MSSVGRESYIERVTRFWTSHINQWYTVSDVAIDLGIKPTSARSACQTLHRRGFLIASDDPGWRTLGVARGSVPDDRRTIARAYRTKLGYLLTSTFEPRRYPEAIFVGEEALVGPFCQHCGNPSYWHGSDGECLNFRMHPLLPLGDLPAAEQ